MKKIYLVLERMLKSVGLDLRIDIPQWLHALREESCVKNWRQLSGYITLSLSF